MIKETFKSRLRVLREKAGLTQAELAAVLGVASTTIANWEAGRIAPEAHNLSGLSEQFAVTMDYLWKGTPDQEKNNYRRELAPVLESQKASLDTIRIKKQLDLIDTRIQEIQSILLWYSKAMLTPKQRDRLLTKFPELKAGAVGISTRGK